MDIFVEVFGLVTGILYLWYEIKHDNRMWYIGIIMALVDILSADECIWYILLEEGCFR